MEAETGRLAAVKNEFLLSRTVRGLLERPYFRESAESGLVRVASFLRTALELPELTTAAAPAREIFGDGRGERWDYLAGPRRSTRAQASALLISDGLKQAFEDAQSLRLSTGGNDQFVGLRYILFVVMTARHGPLEHEVRELFRLSKIARPEAELLMARYCMRFCEPPEKYGAWRDALEVRNLVAALDAWARSIPSDEESDFAKGSAPRDPTVALLHPDDPWAVGIVDQSGAKLEAEAFADMVVARQFTPPLAIGIFGDWGAGKTYFLRLLYEAVADHERRRQKDLKALQSGGDITFCRNVVQIRFNAWHYAEMNLWASLVDHIFTSLRNWTVASGSTKDADRLFEKLTTAQRLTIEAATQLVSWRRAQSEAATRLKIAEAELEKKRCDAEQSAKTFATTAFDQVVDSDAAKAALADALKTVGLAGLVEGVEKFSSAYGTMAGELSRFAMFRAGLMRQVGAPAVVVITVAGTVVLPPLLSFFVEWLGFSAAQLGASIAGLVAPVVFGLSWATARTNHAVDTVSTFRARFDAKVKELTKGEAERVEESEKSLAGAQSNVAEAAAALQLATVSASEAALAYNSETGTRRILHFVRDRLANGDYAKHLGFMATIRRDFEELSRLMAETPTLHTEKSGNTDAAKVQAVHRKRVDELIAESGRFLEPEEQAILRNTAPDRDDEYDRVFERIVLYIDDLDRCPAEQVVNVLQAIHLLLTYPIFVVFVAVDVRWLKQALATRYHGQLGDDDPATATTSDYLEKIFQVPYWVRPFGAESTRTLLMARMGPEEDTVTANATRTSSEQPLEQPTSTPDDDWRRSEDPRPDQSRPKMRRVTLTSPERSCIGAIAAFLNTLPRRSLRFINTYWIIKCSLRPGDQDHLERAGFSALVALLTMAIVLEDDYPGVASSIEQAPSSTPTSEIFDRLVIVRDAQRDQIRSIMQACSNPGLEDLKRYAQLVARYSFRFRTGGPRWPDENPAP